MQGRLGLHDGNRFEPRTMTTPTPNPARILSALEQQPGAWIRTGPRSIEHAGLRVRLTLGIISVRIAYMAPDGAPVPIQAAPATRDRMPSCWRIDCAMRPAWTWISTASRRVPPISVDRADEPNPLTDRRG